MMSFDRYVAICNLMLCHHEQKGLCPAVLSWIGFPFNIIPSFSTFQQPFCGPNIIDHFFCDSFPPWNSYADTSLIELLGFILANVCLPGHSVCDGHLLCGHDPPQTPSCAPLSQGEAKKASQPVPPTSLLLSLLWQLHLHVCPVRYKGQGG